MSEVVAPSFNELLVRADAVRPLLDDLSAVVHVTFTIDWSMLAPKWLYAAMDKSGAIYVYTDKPTRVTNGWQMLIGEALMIQEPYTRRWAETLQGRNDG